jgi:2-polyprenyl-3-methyl-5-hydroxy-6-metoxy-1,4-benzoquinol methylase
MKSKHYLPLVKHAFFSIFKGRLVRDGQSLGIAQEDVIRFYEQVLEKSYANFSADKYLRVDQFTYDKVFFTLAAAHVFAKRRGISVLDVAKGYDHDLKFKIRNEADGVSETDLTKIWAQDGVALFNIFNAIKFNKGFFEATPFVGRKVLDVGCSVGGASWLAWRRGANAFTVSDMAGAALDTAGDVLRTYSGTDVEVVPIVNSSDVPDFGRQEFDVALCLHTFEHTQDPTGLVTSILDALKPGGHFVYTYYHAPVANGINTLKGRDCREEALSAIKARVSHMDGFNLDPYSIGIKKS